MKGVFEISGSSAYDDMIVERYHFPSNYLRQARQCEGDWILYRETGSVGGRKAYIAAARVVRIDPDPTNYSLYYARMADFQELDRPVPYRDSGGRFAEQFLRELPDPSTVGRALRGRSVRTMENSDFAAIVNAGLSATLAPENATRFNLDDAHVDPATRSLLALPLAQRPVEQVLLNRMVRDAAFRHHVLRAYENTCAVTRLKMINGGGRAEAQAAHIWSVKDGGPDVVPNGIALSATVHWLFDRHLISFDEEMRPLVAHNRVPAELRQLFLAAGECIKLPKDPTLHPRPEYVARHRDKFTGLT